MPNLGTDPRLSDLQRYVDQLETERGFASDSVAQKCLLLAEEVGELVKSLRAAQHGLVVDAAKPFAEDPAGELADILTVLAAIANRLDVDLETAFRRKEQINSAREWGRLAPHGLASPA